MMKLHIVKFVKYQKSTEKVYWKRLDKISENSPHKIKVKKLELYMIRFINH